MRLLVNSRQWKGTITELNSSTKVYESGDKIYVDGDSTRFKLGNGINTVADLPWIDSAVKNHTAVAINATATATAAQIAAGVITSTSAAAVALTLPTAALLLAKLGAARGTWFDFAVDNSAGANIITVTASASITAATEVVTGSATLTVASGAVGLFRVYFSSTTVAKIYRIG